MTGQTKRPLAARPAGASKDLLGGEINHKGTDPAAVDPGTALAYGGGFAAQHVAKLVASGVSAETKHARHYTTVTEKATLERAQFSASQRRVPGILIPLHGVNGTTAGYQYRPDTPRTRKGKPVKYETRTGQRNVIDVPPACHHQPCIIHHSARARDIPDPRIQEARLRGFGGAGLRISR